MGISVWQILLIVLLLVLLFGRGKISELMGDMAKGIKSFKSGLEEAEEEKPESIEHQQTETVTEQNTESTARQDSSEGKAGGQ